MNRVREVFRNEYIGAVAIGMIVAQAIGLAVNLIIRPVSYYLVERPSASRGVFGRMETEQFPWPSLIAPAIDLGLLLLISFLLLRWLYLKPRVHEASAAAPGAAEDDQEKGGAA